MTRTRPVGRQGEAGFSLIEVLVTLTILTGLMAVFTPLAGRMLSTWAIDAERAGRADMVTAAVDRLRRDLAVALPAIAEGSDPPVMQFRGSAGGFSMMAATAGGPEIVTVASVDGAGGTPSLLRSSRRSGSADPSRSAETRVSLLDHPVLARFAYRSQTGGDRPDWQDQSRMPEAVIVTFTRGKATLFGGPVILPILATLPVLCVVAEGATGKVCHDATGEAQPADGQSGGSGGTPASGQTGGGS